MKTYLAKCKLLTLSPTHRIALSSQIRALTKSENKKSHRVDPDTFSDKSSNSRKIRKLTNRKIDGENDSERRMFVGRFPVADMNNEANLLEKRTAPEQRCLDHYQEKLHDFPVICRMARDILAIPATSAPVEALFSRVGKLTTKIRNRLKPSPIKRIAILKSRGVLQDKRPPRIIYDLENFESGDDDDAIDAVYDDQEDWLGKDEDYTKVDSLVVGNDITEVSHQSADSIFSCDSG